MILKLVFKTSNTGMWFNNVLKDLFIHLFMAVLSFHCYIGFSLAAERGPTQARDCGAWASHLLWIMGSTVQGLQWLQFPGL